MHTPYSYGTVEWLEQEYQLSEDDPWGLNWRGFERCRYERTLKMLEDAIVKSRKPRSEMAILDVGCSSGFFTHLLRDLAGSVTGIDLSAVAIQRARAKYEGITFQTESVYDPRLGSKIYNVIVCMEVIYYISPSEQDSFLAAVNRLLAENGVILISSKVGSPPYFSEESLTGLVASHFKVARVSHYGCEAMAKCEGFMFGLWKKAHKLRKLLANNDSTKQTNFIESLAALPRQRTMLRKLQFVTGESRVLSWLLEGLARLIIMSTEICLRWKTPSLLANWVARKLNFLPTHTVLLLTKNTFLTTVSRHGLARASEGMRAIDHPRPRDD